MHRARAHRNRATDSGVCFTRRLHGSASPDRPEDHPSVPPPLLRAAAGRLGRRRIELVLVYGQPEPDEASKRDLVSLDWAVERRTFFVPLGRRRLYWQPCLSLVPDADLVIVEQASKLLVNYALLALQLAGVKRLAFWGHGRTPKATPPSRIGEAAKASHSRRAHWWFAYNDLSAGYVRELGFPANESPPSRTRSTRRELVVCRRSRDGK